MRLPFRPLRRCLLIALWTFVATVPLATAPAQAQEEGLLQLDDALHRFLLRQQAAGRLPSAHLSSRPLSAYEAGRYLDSLETHRAALSPEDRQRLDRFQGRTAGPGADFARRYVPFLYPDGQHLFSARSNRYAVQFDPLFYFSYGRARQSERAGRDAGLPVWQNTRGVRAAGHIGQYIFFETRLTENQRRDPRPDFQQNITAPRLSQTRFVDGHTYDYFQAEGIVGFRSRHFEVRFGRERNQWGPGRTSLFLSDYAPAYDQLQIRTTFWRLQYTNVFASMTDLTPLPESFPDQDLPTKFGAFHRLALDLPASVQLSLYEGVIFAPDSTNRSRLDFELSYLNPIIFYRAVERDLGSPDNVLLGAGASWQATSSLQLYGQFMLDEFVADEIFTDSWRNKYGLLLGLRLAGLPVDGLLVDAEYARLRPYLYTHNDPTTSFTNYNDLLGHPAGPNAEAFSLFADYQITPRIDAALQFTYTRRGRAAADSLNIGADPLLSDRMRASDETPFLSGIRQNRLFLEAHAGYELLPGLHLEAGLRAQSVDDEQAGLDRYFAPSLSLRWGTPFRSARY